MNAQALSESGGTHQPNILDMCIAPGGFLSTALSLNPSAQAINSGSQPTTTTTTRA